MIIEMCELFFLLCASVYNIMYMYYQAKIH